MAGVSFALGVSAFVKTQQVSSPKFEPIFETCSKIAYDVDFGEITGYHAYEPKLGLGFMAPFVCLITQFLFELVQTHPSGLLVLLFVNMMAVPVAVLVTVEAGRGGARGMIRYPTIFYLLCQVFGISVAFPALWIPSYCFGGGNGAVAVTRAVSSVLIALPPVILTFLLFCWLDTETYAWTFCAGVLGGPAVSLTGTLLWGVGPPESSSDEIVKKSTEAVAKAFAAAGGLAYIGWVYFCYVVWTAYGFDFSSLWKDLWTEANPSVAFMTIDAGVFWVSLIVFVAMRSGVSRAAETLALSPLFGPGAAFALVMSGLEAERTSPEKAKKKKE